ncbi:MAG: VOC family protein [Flavobacteriaceae bacterium]|nr:VOC family protein [Flavobacteriaceae bacterium]MCY4215712.1 VOC family protein [Flavobacteriaceae bacterium]
MATLSPFHLAIPVNDLEKCKSFYQNTLNCTPGRSSSQWADYNFFGHQLVLHFDANHRPVLHRNEVDGHGVPVPHFGVVLPWEDFSKLVNHLNEVGIEFIIEPYIRFKGLKGEQKTMFFYDPSGNALEFKSFKTSDQLFAT